MEANQEHKNTAATQNGETENQEIPDQTTEEHLRLLDSESDRPVSETAESDQQEAQKSDNQSSGDLPSFSEDIIDTIPTIATLHSINEAETERLIEEIREFNGYGLIATGSKNNKKFFTNPVDINVKRTSITKASVEKEALDKIIESYADCLGNTQRQQELFEVFEVNKGRVNDKLINLYEVHRERIGGIFINKFFQLNGHFPNHLEDSRRNILKAVTPYLLAGMDGERFGDLKVIGGKSLGEGMRHCEFKEFYGGEYTLANAAYITGEKVFGTDRTLHSASFSEIGLLAGGYESLDKARALNLEKVYLGDFTGCNAERVSVFDLIYAGRSAFSGSANVTVQRVGILGEYAFNNSTQACINELVYKVLPEHFANNSLQLRLNDRENSISKPVGFLHGASLATVDARIIGGFAQAFNNRKSSVNELYEAQKSDALEKFRVELYNLPNEADSTQYKLH